MLNFLDAIDYLEKNTTQFNTPKAEPTLPKAEPTPPKAELTKPQSPQESTPKRDEGTEGEELL